jgi:hypothetical protein
MKSLLFQKAVRNRSSSIMMKCGDRPAGEVGVLGGGGGRHAHIEPESYRAARMIHSG